MHEDLVRIALAEVGAREIGGNNLGPRVQEYQTATWLEPAAWPWCAAFTCWVLRQWLATPLGKVYLGPNRGVATWRCKDASAFGWEKWAKNKGLEILPETSLAKAGDFVVFDFSHIGLVAEDQPSRTTSIVTIEGNTADKGDKRDGGGDDGVWIRNRSPNLVRSYIRLGTHAP